jgi:hypothetical protein
MTQKRVERFYYQIVKDQIQQQQHAMRTSYFNDRPLAPGAASSRVTYLTGFLGPVNRPTKSKNGLFLLPICLRKSLAKGQIPLVAATCRKSGSFAGDNVYITGRFHRGKRCKSGFFAGREHSPLSVQKP